MAKDKEKGPQDCDLGEEEEEEEEEEEPRSIEIVKRWTTTIKEEKLPRRFYMYILLLFAGFFTLLLQFGGIKVIFERIPTGQSQNFTIAKIPNQNNTIIAPENLQDRNLSTLSTSREHPLIICSSTNVTTLACPANPPPISGSKHAHETEMCPDYFRWIHEDLKPWKAKGITREAVEVGERLASFRVVVLQGRVYVETYHKCFLTRDVFTIWGIVQLLRFYPGRLPDLDLMFECGDYPVVKKVHYAGGDGDSTPLIPPVFHYCGYDHSFDIPFPDWSFWGWPEVNIKPWESLVKELKEGNERVKWIERMPYAFWKGNIRTGQRATLLRCNSTQNWNAKIFAQSWELEARHGFRQSNLTDQCTHRYKIYMEGRTWSASKKYIQACNSMVLLVKPRYYEFFTRSLVPLKHYWPINSWKLCSSIKFAVDWGNNNTEKAQEIGKEGSKFIMEELKMKNIYDYMLHLLSEYGKLLKYKPTVPPKAVEVCLESMVCNSPSKEKQWKIDSMAKGPSQTGPCTMPPPYDPTQLQKFLNWKADTIGKVDKWASSGDIGTVNFT